MYYTAMPAFKKTLMMSSSLSLTIWTAVQTVAGHYMAWPRKAFCVVLLLLRFDAYKHGSLSIGNRETPRDYRILAYGLPCCMHTCRVVTVWEF